MLWLLVIPALLLILALVMVLRTVRFTKHFPPPREGRPVEGISADEVAAHLAGAIRIPTVSHIDPAEVDWTQFERFHAYLEETYPLIHRTMEREKLAGYNLIYRWPGTDSQARPIAFLSHMDVVPISDESAWEHPPFSGDDDGTYIWGRGAVDMKNQLIVVMEACERLIAQGFRPREDVYLCFGQNEEVGDLPEMTGADAIAATLRERGIRFDCVIDEGGAIAGGSVLGLSGGVCLVGVAERGFATCRLESRSEGGHSSRPPRHTALGRVCRAAARVEDHPLPPRLIPPVRAALETLAPYMPSFPVRLVAANLWLLGPLMARLAAKIPMVRPLVSTTFAVTQAQGSSQDNILPQYAYVGVNVRILPGQTVEDVRQYLERVAGDPEVKVTVVKSHLMDAVSPWDTAAMKTIGRLADRYYPGTVTSPFIMFGGSDARNYYQISDNVYRFMPFCFGNGMADVAAHRANERIEKSILPGGVAILMDFIREYEGEKDNG